MIVLSLRSRLLALRGASTNLSLSSTVYNNCAVDDDDRYFLSGVFSALDSPGEFFLNDTERRLYFWPHDGQAPAGRVTVKSRDYCLEVSGAVVAPTQTPLTLKNVDFVGCAFDLVCDGCSVQGVRLTYPSYNKYIPEMNVAPAPTGSAAAASVQGNNNVLERLSISHTNNYGLKVSGDGNLLNDSVIVDTCWLGTLTYPAASFGGHFNQAIHNSVRRLLHCSLTTRSLCHRDRH